jgi:glycine/D-amino acid oxidase-like deaminating enzyme
MSKKVTPSGAEAGYLDEPPRRTRVHARTEVLVVGGGAAGVAAAVAAARNGARTILVERGGALGGLATGGLIILLLTMDDGAGHRVIGGLCEEVVERLAARRAAFFPHPGEWGSRDAELVERDRRWGLVWGSAPHRVRYSVAYDPEEMRFALSNLCAEAGVRLLFHSLACEGLRDGDRLRGVAFQGKSGRFAILADVVIDASGDGDVLASVGVPFELERVLPWLWLRMGGIADVEAALDAGGAFFRTLGDGQVLLPWGATDRIVAKIDATDPEDLTRAELECRRNVMAAVDELRRTRPEFARAHVCEIARDLGITESRRMLGRVVLRREDMDRRREDAVALTGHWTRYGALYWIPYGSLLAPEIENLVVAGRCISADHRAHHATKEIPPCMATGQAAGTAAAMAVRGGIAPARLDVARLRERLLAQGAILDLG